jgi:filamentous hemagglutinin family protein
MIQSPINTLPLRQCETMIHFRSGTSRASALNLLRSATSRVLTLNLWLLQGRSRTSASLALATLTLTTSPALAQIAGDGSLGTLVNGAATAPCTVICVITNGTTRGQNLFHSLQQFSLPNATDAAGFVTPSIIQNVIVRVTGVGQPFISTVNGTIVNLDENNLANLSRANLFLINPNGIVFGPNARLDGVGGSFTATTANAIEFGNQGQFRATNPNNSVPLLTINPSAYLFNQLPTGRIVNQSVANGGMGLQVPNGRNLTLLGNDVTIVGGQLTALGGRVEIGAVAGIGRVEQLPNGALSFAPNLLRGDIGFSNGAGVDVRLSNGGVIAITGRDVTIAGGSELLSGIVSPGGTSTSQAGDVRVDASGVVRLTGASQIRNAVGLGVTGNAGNVQIQTRVLEVRDGSQLIASTLGIGSAGNVQIAARDRVLFQGSSADGRFVSAATSSVESGTTGKGGSVIIDTGSLEVRDGAALVTSTRGTGDAGNVQITARDRVLFQNLSAAASSVGTGATGKGGNLVINTGNLEVRDGAQLNASTFGNGDAGNVQITARNSVLFQNLSSASSSVGTDAIGKGGNVVIDTSSLEVRDGAALVASTRGTGDAGNVQITARNSVLFQGSSADGQFVSTAASSMEAGAMGKGGNVVIDTGSLEVRDGAQLLAYTLGNGDAGNVQITARDLVLLDGTDPTSGRSGVILTGNGQRLASGSVFGGTGRGGDVRIRTAQLTISNGAMIDARTANDQSGGNITLDLGNLTLLSDGRIATISEGSGAAGRITVTASSQVRIIGAPLPYADLLAQLGIPIPPVSSSGLYVRATSTGAAGDIVVNTPNLTLDQQGRIDAESFFGNGGNITLNVSRLLLLRNGSQISTNAGTVEAGGNGGSITINIPNGFIIAVLKENSDISANAFSGNGGRVNITAQGIYGLRFQPRPTPFSDITASSTFGVSGVVAINTLGLDPSGGLVQLPTGLVDPSNKVDQRCAPKGAGRASTFTATGTGGIAASPTDPLMSQGAVMELVELPEGGSGLRADEPDRLTAPSATSAAPIVEAQGWIVDRDGTVHLVADARVGIPQNPTLVPPDCSIQPSLPASRSSR